MRMLEHRRHARPDATRIHLSRVGTALTRKVGASLPRFDRVVTSPKPRAVETAQAMGFRVDATLDALAETPGDAGVSMEESPPRTFADFVTLVEQSAEMAGYAREQLGLWRAELEKVRENGALLLVSHSGVVESGAAAAVPREARGWGPSLAPLEGVRLTWDGARWTSGEVVRVPE
jgi:phosphohistidine phosphatase SixA